MTSVFHRETGRVVSALACCVIAACNTTAPTRKFHAGRRSFDTSPLDITAIRTNPAVRRHVLYMTFGEAAARLGALHFEGDSHFVFNRGGDTYDQHNTYDVIQTAKGDFHVQLKTPREQVEVYLVGDNIYIRYGTGHLRKKPRRQVETDSWPELAFSALHQTLDLFKPRLALVDPQATTVDGRSAIRYRIQLGKAHEDVVTASELPETPLPVAPPAHWRQLARPLDLTGQLSVDAATGVILRSKIDGRLEIDDRNVRPTQLRISYSSGITEIGAVAPIHVPKSIPQIRRRVPPRHLLSFFKDELPAPKADSTP